jgi:hypothetical protein
MGESPIGPEATGMDLHFFRGYDRRRKGALPPSHGDYVQEVGCPLSDGDKAAHLITQWLRLTAVDATCEFASKQLAGRLFR